MGTPGYVYALINPSTPNIIKVGMTTRDPSDRVLELSSATGVATPFILAYKEHFSDCNQAEKYVHTLLERQGVRVSTNREFFHAELSEIVQAISLAPGKCPPGNGFVDDDDDDLLNNSHNDALNDLNLENYKPKTPEEEVYEEAEAHYYGIGNVIQDQREALRLFRQSAKMGSGQAFHMIGRIYSEGDAVRQDYSKALDYYKEAARRGIFCAYGQMARIFYETSHAENEQKAWKMFFDELRLNPNKSFECDTPGLIVHGFLFLRTSTPSMFSPAKIKLTANEEKYVEVMRMMKDNLIEASQMSYDISVDSNGESDVLTKRRKHILAWANAL